MLKISKNGLLISMYMYKIIEVSIMIDQLVLFVMALNKNLEAGELFRRELDLGLREKSSGSSAAVPGLSVRVASAVHGILVLALIAAIMFIV